MPREKEHLRVISHRECLVEERITELYDYRVIINGTKWFFDKESIDGCGIVAGPEFSTYTQLSADHPMLSALYEEFKKGNYTIVTDTPEGKRVYDTEADYS